MIKKYLILIILALCGVTVFLFNRFQIKKVFNIELGCGKGGSTISYFDLIGDDGVFITTDFINNRDQMHVIYIFGEPCTPCNKNLAIWNKISAVCSNFANFHGVAFGNMQEVLNIPNNMKVNFKIFYPKDTNRFVKYFNVQARQSQTILYKNSVVIYSKEGDLDFEDYIKIVDRIKA
jgi:hypothetical protein